MATKIDRIAIKAASDAIETLGFTCELDTSHPHPAIKVTKDGRSARIYYSGSPRSEGNTREWVGRDARRLARDWGLKHGIKSLTDANCVA